MNFRRKQRLQKSRVRHAARRHLIAQRLEDRRLLAAGPYPPAAGQAGSTAVPMGDPALVGWATGVEEYQAGDAVAEQWQDSDQALGPADGTSVDVVSLGGGGQITLSFDNPIRNGIGPDFAVFENSFNDTFLELGFVEVSSDGQNFVRFSNDSLTADPVGLDGEVDPTNVDGLAGKYRQGFGTPFDLEQLIGSSPQLNTGAVTHVRLVDIVGDGTQTDSSGDPIYDPYPTAESAGLDVDAVGVINSVESIESTVGFEDVGASLSNQSAWYGPDPEGDKITGPFDDEAVVGEFESGELRFNNAYSVDFDSWNQWAYSNQTDTTTAGFTNQFSAFPGSGANGSKTFGVANVNVGGFYDLPTIELSANDARIFDSLQVTNTTYAAQSMLQGDSFAKKFGGADGDDPDWFLLTIEGTDGAGDPVGTVDFYLADYRFDDNSLDYVVDQWTEIDLSPLREARSLEFTLTSSDVGDFGMNTPAYFAADEIVMRRPVLPFDLASTNVSEAGGESATTGRVSRVSGDTSKPLQVTLAASDESVAEIPETITIGAGETYAEFDIAVMDNELVDGDRQITIEASADGLIDATTELTVSDDDVPSLSIETPAEPLSEDLAPPTASLEELGKRLPPESFDNGSDGDGGFASSELQFNNSYNESFGTWSGWSYSNTTDTTTAGFRNQYSALPGGGAAGSDTYAVAAAFSGSPAPTIVRDGDSGFQSLEITNTTFAAQSMRDGDDFAKKFGGESGDDPDWFLLTIEGLDSEDQSVGTIDFYLADYRFDDNSLDYIVDRWTTVNVSSLSEATKLSFSLSSSDVGDFGMNTPAYFALDNVVLDSQQPAPTMRVSRNTADLSSPLEVNLTSDDASELQVSRGVTIPPGADSVEVPLNIYDDVLVDGDQSVTLRAQAADHESAEAQVTAVDNDIAGLLIQETEGSTIIDEAGPADRFDVLLNTQPSDEVVVTITAPDTDDFSIDTAQLVFTPDNWDQPQSINVTGTADLILEPDEQAQVEVAVDDSTSASRFAGIAPGFLTVKIQEYAPENLRLIEDGGAVVLIDDETRSLFQESTLENGIDVVATDRDETITVGELPNTSGKIDVDTAGGDDTVEILGERFTSLDGGNGNDQLILATQIPDDLAAFLADRITGFENLVLAGEASSEIRIDAEAMQAVLGDEASLLIDAQSNSSLSFEGEWTLGTHQFVDSTFTQVVQTGEVTLHWVSETPWQNVLQKADVNHDGRVSARDALTIINRLNRSDETALSAPTNNNPFGGFYFDVSGDNRVTALDALRVINHLNRADQQPADGERADAVDTGGDLADGLMVPAAYHPSPAPAPDRILPEHSSENAQGIQPESSGVRPISAFEPREQAIRDLFTAESDPVAAAPRADQIAGTLASHRIKNFAEAESGLMAGARQ